MVYESRSDDVPHASKQMSAEAIQTETVNLENLGAKSCRLPKRQREILEPPPESLLDSISRNHR